jgi:hypothetical protein
MNALDGLKKTGQSLVNVANWVGTNFTAILTISLAVLGFLFSRERQKNAELQADIDIKDKADQVAQDQKEVKKDEDQAADSLTDYQHLAANYKHGKRD